MLECAAMSSDTISREAEFFDRTYAEGRLNETGAFLTDTPDMRFIMRTLGGLKGKRVLDLGCGVGSLSLALAARGAIVSAIDVSGEAVKQTTENCARFGFTVDAVQMSATELTFVDETFDAVCGVAILHHLLHHDFGQHVMDELWRILKPEGTAIFAENNGDNLLFMFLRNHRCRLGAKRIGDDDESPLTADVVRGVAGNFAVSFHHPELFLFRALSTWIRPFKRFSNQTAWLDRQCSVSQTVNRFGWARMVCFHKPIFPSQSR